jgi:phosphoribosylglycinamide formyltransferase-1
MMSLVEAAHDPSYPAEIVLVLANRPDAGGLAWAEAQGIPAACVDHKAFADRPAFEEALDARLRAHAVEIVCLAGFLRVLTPWFIGRWEGRLLNIHPSLLPAYRGLHTHERALADGVRLHGCSIHFVVPELDAGPLLAQAAVPVREDDTPTSLGARVLHEEHRLYPAVLAWVASGRARLVDGRAVVDVAPAEGALANPALR